MAGGPGIPHSPYCSLCRLRSAVGARRGCGKSRLRSPGVATDIGRPEDARWHGDAWEELGLEDVVVGIHRVLESGAEIRRNGYLN